MLRLLNTNYPSFISQGAQIPVPDLLSALNVTVLKTILRIDNGVILLLYVFACMYRFGIYQSHERRHCTILLIHLEMAFCFLLQFDYEFYIRMEDF